MEVPQGFEKYYNPILYILLLLQTIYELKQPAIAFWKKLLKAMKSIKFQRCKADPYLYFTWSKKHGLALWISWIDDCLVEGTTKGMTRAKNKMVK